jgi:PAS domain S-box-containing protein
MSDIQSEDLEGGPYRILNRQIAALRSRADQLKDTGELRDAAFPDDLLMEALEELSTALEELQVTEEELQIQHEELLMTRQRLDEQRQIYEDLFNNAPDGYIVTDIKGVIQQVNRAASKILNVRQDLLLGKPFSVYFAELDRADFHMRIRDFIHQAPGPEGAEVWEVELSPRYTPEIIVELRMTLVQRHQQEPVAIRWLLRDITQQKEMERELRNFNANLEQRVRERTQLLQMETQLKDAALARAKAARDEAEALRDIGNILSSTLELSEVLEKILANVGRLVHHDGADILLLDDETVTAALCVGYTFCLDQKVTQEICLPLNETFPLNEIAKSGEPYVINMLETPTAWMQALGMSFTPRSYVGVPILAQGVLLGFLNLTNAVSGFYSSSEVEILQAFSSQASIAIQNAQLYKQAKTVSVLEERQRLARDLHDAVSQSLFTSTIVSEALLQSKEKKSARLTEQLEYLRRLNRGAQAEMRALLLELRPAHLTDVDLPKQIRGLVESVRGRKEIDITLIIDDGVPMPPDVQVQFYRIAQEAMNNIVKHARAKHVDVLLVSNKEHVRIDIRDDGCGMDLTSVNKGMGFANMRERAEEIGAEFSVSSSPGQGTAINVVWIREEEENHE